MAPDEQRLLLLLALFRSPAPADAFDLRLIERLVASHLLQRDQRGSLLLHPAYATAIADLIDPETRELLHLEAANLLIQRGAMTAAAYHLVQAHQPGPAVWLWDSQRVQEINQGQAATALEIFSSVSANQLAGADREALLLLRAELYKLAGEHGRAAETLQHGSWQNPVLQARASLMAGELADLRDEFEQAAKAYRSGLESLAPLLGSAATELRVRLSRIAMRQKELDRAWDEAQLAHYELEKTRGQIKEELGEYDAALAHYQAALALAEQLKHTQGEAKAHDNMAAVLALQGSYDQAQEHWVRACVLLEQIGNLDALASVYVNRAFGYNLAGTPAEAVPAAEMALAIFQRLGVPTGRAVAAQNLAEAHLSLGHFEQAEQYAFQVLAEEEATTIPDGLRVLGELQLARGQYDSAEASLRRALAAAEENRDPFLSAYIWRSLSRLFHRQRRESEAETAHHEALARFGELGLTGEVQRTIAEKLGETSA